MLFLALSCLQGRPMQAAADELLSLGAVGLQLTPGNAPTPDFLDWLAGQDVPTTTHQGFTPVALRSSVWRGTQLTSASDSVHPPRSTTCSFDSWFASIVALDDPPAVEVMFPGHHLGCGAQVEQAMDASLPLAVDVSHVHIQREQGTMSQRTWARLQAHDQVVEVHVSANDGHRDQHRSPTPDSFGVGWSMARADDGTPLVLESYLHHLDRDERRAVIEPFLEHLP